MKKSSRWSLILFIKPLMKLNYFFRIRVLQDYYLNEETMKTNEDADMVENRSKIKLNM